MSFDIHSARPATSPQAAATIPASPPPEVCDAIAVARQAYEKLQQAGRRLSFEVDDRTGTLSIEVHDLEGNFLFTLSPSEFLDIAGGGPLE